MADVLISRDGKGQEFALIPIASYEKKFGSGRNLNIRIPDAIIRKGVDMKIFIDTAAPQYAKMYFVEPKQEKED